MEWYKNAIRKYAIDSTGAILGAILATVIMLIWFYFTSDTYEWQSIDIIPLVPWIPYLISALTFATIWRVLYKTKLIYPPLYFICITLLRDRRLYDDFKAFIWAFLMLFMWIIALPVFVSFINFLISLVVNVLFFLFYISPPLFISWVIILSISYFISRKHDANTRRYRKV